VVLKTGLVVENEDFKEKYLFSLCGLCGGRRVTRTFLTSDGFDDVDWDEESWCEDCDGLSKEFKNLNIE
jgi:hypothetical protein